MELTPNPEEKNSAQDQPTPNTPQGEQVKVHPFAYFILGIIAGFILSSITGVDIFNIKGLVNLKVSSDSASSANANDSLPSFSKDAILPVRWGSLGKQMAESGVIDAQNFEKIYAQRGGLDENSKKLLYSDDNGEIVINAQNAGYLLNLLWALGLGNKNPVLDDGPMQDKQYGGAGNFASTGGWSLAKGQTMDHYSKHNFIYLTPQQQALVEKVSKGIYRPCCGNSTYFPDCNHGMAMLGLLELMASQGLSESEMYKTALVVNSYWFPDTYKTIAKYEAQKGIKWEDVNPQEVLGINFSSAQGFRQISSQVAPIQGGGGGSCGV